MNIDSNLAHLFLNEQENLSRASVVSTQRTNVLITPPPSADELARLDREAELLETRAPRLEPKDIVEFQSIDIDLEHLNASGEINNSHDGFDIRSLSPREIADFSLDLYIDGSLSYEEYSVLAFQPELEPSYNNTIGALTGHKAQPDRPRDYIRELEDRLNFESRYPSETNAESQIHIARILDVLQSFEQRLNFVA